jgi:hypothetical protein
MLGKEIVGGEKMAKPYDVRAAVLETGFSAKYIRDLLYAERIPGARKVRGKWELPAAAVEKLRKRKQGQ